MSIDPSSDPDCLCGYTVIVEECPVHAWLLEAVDEPIPYLLAEDVAA
jgi:hypothetical protein